MEANLISGDSSSPSDDPTASVDENAAVTPISYAESFSASFEDDSTQVVVHVCSFDAIEAKSGGSRNQPISHAKLNSIVESPRFFPIPEKRAPEFTGNLSADLMNDAEEYLRVSAEISGRSTPEVNWYMNGDPIASKLIPGNVTDNISNSDPIKFEREGNTHRLVMKDFLMDEGNWKISCIAVNSMGVAKSSIMLGHHTETQYLSASQTQLFEHREDEEEEEVESEREEEEDYSDRGSEEGNQSAAENSDGIFEVYQRSISENSGNSSKQQLVREICKFSAKMKVCLFGKGLICETQIEKKHQKLVDVMWLLDGRVIKQSEFSRILENEYNNIFALEISNISILSRQTQNLTCVVSFNGTHMHQSTNIVNMIDEIANDGCQSFFLEGTLKTQDLLLFHQFNREIVSVKKVSEITAHDLPYSDEDENTVQQGRKVCFRVSVHCDNNESENLNAIWLVDGEIVLAQKSYLSEINENCCQLTILLSEYQLKVSRVDFYLVCACGVNVEVIHRNMIKPQLIGKPYLEIIDNCQMLLVEVPLDSRPSPTVECFVSEESIESFQWQYSALEQMCSVVFQDLLSVRRGDVRIVLSNPIGSLSVTLTREQIQRLQQKVEQGRHLKGYRHSSDITRKITQPDRVPNWKLKQRLFQNVHHLIERPCLHVLSSSQNFKTSAIVEMGRDRKTTLKTMTNNFNGQLVPHGDQKSCCNFSLYMGAFNLNRETLSIILTKNLGDVFGLPGHPMNNFVPFGSKIKLTSSTKLPSKWICAVSPHKNENVLPFDDDSNESTQTPKKVTALIIICEYSDLMSDDDIMGRPAVSSADWLAPVFNQSVSRIGESDPLDDEPIRKQCRKSSLLFLSGSNPNLNNDTEQKKTDFKSKIIWEKKENGDAIVTKTFQSGSFVKVASEDYLNLQAENQLLQSNDETAERKMDKITKVDRSEKENNLLGQNTISSIQLSSVEVTDYNFHRDYTSDSSDSSHGESLSDFDSEIEELEDAKVEALFKHPENFSELQNDQKCGPSPLNAEEKPRKSSVETYRENIMSKLLSAGAESSCESISPLQEQIEESLSSLTDQLCSLQNAAPVHLEERCTEREESKSVDLKSNQNIHKDLVCEIGGRETKILQDVKDIYAFEGETMVLQLMVFNADHCEWRKNGRKVFGSRFCEKTTLKEGNVFVHELLWKSVQEWEDGVRFSCQVWNDDANGGAAEKTLVSKEATLHIVSKPSVDLPRRYGDGIIRLSRGDPFSVSLPLGGRPKPKWSWKKVEDSAAISEGTGDKAHLKIENVDTSHAGFYNVEAANDYGSDVKKLQVIVEGPPGPVSNFTVSGVHRLCLQWDPPNDSTNETLVKYYHIQGRFTYTSKWRSLIKTCETTCFLDHLPNLNWLRVIGENQKGLDELQEHPEVKVVHGDLIQEVLEPSYLGQISGIGDFESCDERVLIGKFGSSKAFNCCSNSGQKWIELLSITGTCLLCNKLVQVLIHEKQSLSVNSSVFIDFLHLKTSKDPILGDVSCYYLQSNDLTDFFDPEGWLSSNSEKQVAENVLQMLRAIDFLHDRNFLYLSLHPLSMALDRQNGFSVKLIRFANTTRTDPSLRVQFFGHLDDFYAPEILNQQPVGKLTDTWTVGAIAYFMLTGNLLESSNPKDGPCSVDHNTSLMSADAKDFIKSMVQKSPLNRTTIKHAIDHKWFEENFEISKIKDVSNADFKALKEKMQSIMLLTKSTSIYGMLTYVDAEEPATGNILCCSIDAESAAPIFVEKPAEMISAKLGEDISLQCVVSALSPPVITWRFLDTELRPGLKYRIRYASLESKVSTDRQSCSLRITKCQHSDSGYYLCEATNCYGSTNFKIVLDVS